MSALWRTIIVQMFMRDLKKVSALWSVGFRVSTLERFCYKGFLRNSSETKFFVRFREVSALGRFHCIFMNFSGKAYINFVENVNGFKCFWEITIDTVNMHRPHKKHNTKELKENILNEIVLSYHKGTRSCSFLKN